MVPETPCRVRHSIFAEQLTCHGPLRFVEIVGRNLAHPAKVGVQCVCVHSVSVNLVEIVENHLSPEYEAVKIAWRCCAAVRRKHLTIGSIQLEKTFALGCLRHTRHARYQRTYGDKARHKHRVRCTLLYVSLQEAAAASVGKHEDIVLHMAPAFRLHIVVCHLLEKFLHGEVQRFNSRITFIATSNPTILALALAAMSARAASKTAISSSTLRSLTNGEKRLLKASSPAFMLLRGAT